MFTMFTVLQKDGKVGKVGASHKGNPHGQWVQTKGQEKP
jgi:hypothetical protein